LRGDYFLFDAYTSQHLYERSDNYPFAKKGIPANTILLSSPTDMYYHHYDDEWETLDFELMESVVKAIAIAITPSMYK
jgi:Zn-dependent M28 family amino/carboxypeptidase